MKEKTVLIFVHGFKKQGRNDFDTFLDQNSEELSEYEIVKIKYYDGNDKRTININGFDAEFNKTLHLYNDRKVKIIAYSFGCLLTLKNINTYDNINDIYLSMPTLFIDYFTWVKFFKETKKKEIKLKKRLGKERFKRIKRRMFDRYLVNIGRTINKYINKYRENISLVNNKNITVIYSFEDEISCPDKTIPFLKEKLSNNNLNIKRIEGNHFATFDKKDSENTKHLLDFIKK